MASPGITLILSTAPLYSHTGLSLSCSSEMRRRRKSAPTCSMVNPAAAKGVILLIVGRSLSSVSPLKLQSLPRSTHSCVLCRNQGLPHPGSSTVPSPFIPPLTRIPQEVVPNCPLRPWHPTDDSEVVDFALHPRNKVMLEEIHIWHHSDEVLAQMHKDSHCRHCIWCEIEVVEPIEVHDRLKNPEKGGQRS